MSSNNIIKLPVGRKISTLSSVKHSKGAFSTAYNWRYSSSGEVINLLTHRRNDIVSHLRRYRDKTVEVHIEREDGGLVIITTKAIPNALYACWVEANNKWLFFMHYIYTSYYKKVSTKDKRVERNKEVLTKLLKSGGKKP